MPPKQKIATSGRLNIDIGEDGVRLPSGFADAVNVLIDGHRVWSFTPYDRKSQPDANGVIPWPGTLKPHLAGAGRFEVRRIADDESLFEAELRLGDGDGRISIIGKSGTPLAIDKGGRLSRMFNTQGESSKQALVVRVQETLDVLNGLGIDAFLAFGCLLGAVREGKLIGHDSDADVAYLSSATHPFDVVRESIRIERHFVDLGWNTRRMSGADFKVFAEMPDGSSVGIDVFGSFFDGETYYLMPSVTGTISRASLVPQSTVELEGVEVTAPADPEALLEITYGPHWRIPDPSFKFAPSLQTRRFLAGLMRGERKHHQYWDHFYRNDADRVSREPSPFATWVAEREPDHGGLVDIGSGTGRDTLWFSAQGFDALGLDYSGAGVSYAAKAARQAKLSAQFAQLNLYDTRHILVRGAMMARDRTTDIVYARFLVHAMEDAGRENLWVLSRSLLRQSRGRLYLEFRTEATQHEFGEHYRQFVQPDVVAAELVGHGFEIEHNENKHGLAVHKSEDPRVCRIVARMR